MLRVNEPGILITASPARSPRGPGKSQHHSAYCFRVSLSPLPSGPCGISVLTSPLSIISEVCLPHHNVQVLLYPVP